eukprot:gene11301-2055_t
MRPATLLAHAALWVQTDGLVPAPRATPAMGYSAWNTFSVNGVPERPGRKGYAEIVDALVDSGMVAAGWDAMGTVCTDWTGRDPATGVLQQNETLWPGGMASFADYVHSKGLSLAVYTTAAKKNCCGEPVARCPPRHAPAPLHAWSRCFPLLCNPCAPTPAGLVALSDQPDHALRGAHRPQGSEGYEELDIATFASWGADSVAVDYCGGPPDVEGAYQKYADAIVKAPRPMSLAVYNLGRGQAWKWAPQMGQNLTTATEGRPSHGSWIPMIRLTPDIGNYWSGTLPPTKSVMSLVEDIEAIPDLWDYGMGNTSGTYPQYGQLAVGVPPGHPTSRDPGLTLPEAQSHFSMWCLFASELLATNDVRIKNSTIDAILMNPETIRINQDPWSIPATRLPPPSGCGGTLWSRGLANGDTAVLALNTADGPANLTVDLSLLPALGGLPRTAFQARDIQKRADLGKICRFASFPLVEHESAFIRLTPTLDPCNPEPQPACTEPGHIGPVHP